MLRIQMIGLAVVAALVMSAVAAGSASAAHEWLINGKPIASRVKVHSLGLFLFGDTKAIGGEVKIHCHFFDTGTVGPGSHDLIEKLTTTLLGTNERFSCTFDKAGACNSGALLLTLPLHLPWLTLIKLIGTNVRDLLEKDGNGGNPGWKVVCTNILGGESVDECTKEVNSTGLINAPSGRGVEAVFDNESLNDDCTVGGSGAGSLSGSDLIENPSATEKLTFG